MKKKQDLSSGNDNFWMILLAAAYRNGYSQAQICEKLGLSRAYISRGKTLKQTPLLSTAIRLFNACDYEVCAVPYKDVPKSAFVLKSAEQSIKLDEENNDDIDIS